MNYLLTGILSIICLKNFDNVGIIATDSQVGLFKPVFDKPVVKESSDKDVDINDIIIDQLVVNEYTQLKGLSIQDSGLRERTNGLIIGTERNNERMLNPDSTTVFEWNDVVWIVGERNKIQSLKETRVSAK